MHRYFFLKSGLPLLFAAITAVHANPQPTDSGGGLPVKKLLAFGWDSPTPQALLENLKEMEKTPFSGVRVQLETEDEAGNKVSFRTSFTGVKWDRKWFEKDVETLKKVQSKQLTDNFLSVGPGPGLDWFDDAAWEQVADHFRVAAWVAREGGLKGSMFDPEIGRSLPVFAYIRQAQREKYSFAEYAAKARERGRQVMEALKGEYPDMTLFTLFMNSGTALGALGADPREGLEGRRDYSLYPAFVNGWLDVVPATMTIVDGAEYAYPHSSELQYLKHANSMRHTTLGLVAPENRTKYRTQVQTSLAVYMDAYTGHPLDNVHSDVFKDPPLEGRLVDRFQDALFSAQEIVDEYVWVWGEQYRWWPTDAKRVKPQTWDHILPGVSQALRNALDPEKVALARAAKEFAIRKRKVALGSGVLKNVIQNGSFAVPEKGSEGLADWAAKSVTGSDAILSHDPAFGCRSRGAVRMEAASEAVLSQEVEVTPYGFYKIRLKTRQMGEGRPEVRLHWAGGDTDGDGKQTAGLKLTPVQSPRDGWQSIEGVVRAPSGSTRLGIELVALEQKSPDDVLWFDDVEIIPIGVN